MARNFGFGQDASSLVSVEDVLKIGVWKLVPSYLFVGTSFALAYFFGADEPLRIKSDTLIELHPSLKKGRGYWLFKVLPYVAAISVAYNLLVNRVILVEISAILMAYLATVIIAKFTAINGISRNKGLATALGFFALATLLGQAYAEGFRFRTSPIEKLQDHPSCGRGIKVLFPVGENFVGLRPDGTRVVIKEDCSTLFEFPRKVAVLDVR